MLISLHVLECNFVFYEISLTRDDFTRIMNLTVLVKATKVFMLKFQNNLFWKMRFIQFGKSHSRHRRNLDKNTK